MEAPFPMLVEGNIARMDNGKLCGEGFEENTMALLDTSGIKDSHDIHEDRVAFLEAVRSIYLDCDSKRPPSWKIYNATFNMLRGCKSLELVMASFQILTELNKKFPRTSLANEGNSPDIFVNYEAWSPFVLGTEGISVEDQSSKNTRNLLDPVGFACLVESIAQDVSRPVFVLGIDPLQNMILFQYVVEVLEADLIPHKTLYKELQNWVLFRQSMLNMLLGSRRIHQKSFIKNCMAIMLRRCCHQILEEDCKMPTDELNVPLVAALAEIQRRTFGAMEKFLTLVMDLDWVRKEADSHGATSRIDGSRSPAIEVILDELTYNINDFPHFLMAFSVPKWKLEIILHFLSKYCTKTQVRTRRANVPNEITVDYILSNFSTTDSTKIMGKKISSGNLQMLLAHLFQACLLEKQGNNRDGSSEKIGGTLVEISAKFLLAIQNIIKTEEGLDIMPFVREASFTAAVLARNVGKDDKQI